MPYEIYKMIHLTGIFLLISGLVGCFTMTWSGSTLAGKIKTFAFATHGTGLILILVSGFGLLARLGVMHGQMPTWAYVKLAVWAVMAIFISAMKRKGQLGWPLYILFLSVYLVAAYSAVYKPGM